MSKATRWRLAGLAVVVTIGVASTLLLPVKEYLAAFVHWIQAQGPLGAIVLGLSFIPACLLFVPGAPITLAAGFLYGVPLGIAVVSGGSVLGASAAFLVGRTIGRGLVEPKISAHPKFRVIDEAVGKQAFKIVLLLRLSPVFPFNLLNYAFGLTKVGFWQHLFASWIGMLPGTAMYVYLGSAVKSLTDGLSGDVAQEPGTRVLFYVGLAATIAATLYITHLARQALAEFVPAGQAPEKDRPAP